MRRFLFVYRLANSPGQIPLLSSMQCRPAQHEVAVLAEERVTTPAWPDAMLRFMMMEVRAFRWL
jgi:hypothetical protein